MKRNLRPALLGAASGAFILSVSCAIPTYLHIVSLQGTFMDAIPREVAKLFCLIELIFTVPIGALIGFLAARSITCVRAQTPISQAKVSVERDHASWPQAPKSGE